MPTKNADDLKIKAEIDAISRKIDAIIKKVTNLDPVQAGHNGAAKE